MKYMLAFDRPYQAVLLVLSNALFRIPVASLVVAVRGSASGDPGGEMLKVVTDDSFHLSIDRARSLSVSHLVDRGL